VEEFRFAPPATAAGTVALLALEIAFSPVPERAPIGVDAASEGGVPRRVGVSLPRCPEAVAVVAAERFVALPGLLELMPFRLERLENPVPLDVTVLRGDAALELWMALDLQGALCEDPTAAPAPDGMVDLGVSCPRDVGEIEPRWKVEPVEGEVDVVPTEGDRKLPVVPRVVGPTLPRGTAPRLVDAPPPSGTALR